MRNIAKGSKIMGYVEMLPSGNFKGVARNYLTGKRKSKTHTRWAQAHAWMLAEEAQDDASYADVGIEINRQQRGLPSFADHVIEWARTGVDGELATQRVYQSQARSLAARWPTQRVDEITPTMVSSYFTELRTARYAPSTRTLRLVTLRHAMHAAVAAGYRPDDPTLGIKCPKAREHQARILTEQELMLVLACLPGWLWPAALLSHDAGPRISEICGLRMTNLDLLHGTVTVADIIDIDGQPRPYTKGKASRTVPLSPRCLAALRHHVSANPPAGALGYVFRHPSGRRLMPDTVRHNWDKALRLAVLDGEKPTWHDLRHGCATILSEAGVDPFVIMEILGHGNIATTMRYVRRANLTRQAAAVDLAFGDQAG